MTGLVSIGQVIDECGGKMPDPKMVALHAYGSRKRVLIDATQVRSVIGLTMGDGFFFSEIIFWDNNSDFVVEDASTIRRRMNKAIHDLGKKWWIGGKE